MGVYHRDITYYSAADFAIIRTIDMEIIGIPWVDIVVNF